MSLQLETIPQTRASAPQELAVGRGTAVFLCVAFFLGIGVPPVHQLVYELRQTGRWRCLSLFEQVPSRESLRSFEDSIARESKLAGQARIAYQTLLTRALRPSTDSIVIGRDGFLFYRTEVDMASGAGFLSRRGAPKRGQSFGFRRSQASDVVAAIVDFGNQLRARGIRLVFVPLPVKPFIYPENVWRGYPVSAGPAWNQDRELFKSRLAAAGVDVLDVTDDLWKAKTAGGEELFLKLDTHWSPRGLAVVADRIAAHVRPLVSAGADAFETRSVSVTHYGDLVRMLEVDPREASFLPQAVQVAQVHHGGQIARGDESSPILLLGDSFTNIYSRRELEWGEGAGLGEQLMLRLATPVQVIAVNGGGATIVRESVAQRPQSLAAKKLVIWACSARDLFDETVIWEPVPLSAQR